MTPHRTPRRPLRPMAALVASALVIGLAGGPAAARPGTGRVRLLSLGMGEAPADGPSGNSSFSSDGRYVAFSSRATNLVPADTNDTWDVFVLDQTLDQVERVSVATDGSQSDGASIFPSISSDGRYVAFQSDATTFASGGTNGTTDVFIHDRQTGTTELVSGGLPGTGGNNGSYYPTVSADGRLVCFYSTASNLVAGDVNDVQDIFVYDRQTDATELVSVGWDGALGNNSAYLPSMSADGRYVAWESPATNMVPADSNNYPDVFIRDRLTGTTQRASLGPNATQADDGSLAPSVSADGRYVAFTSYATNLIPSDTNGVPDVFIRDLQTGTNELASVGSVGAQGNASAFVPSLSADGRYVAFESSASNLVPGDTNAASDVFLHDRVSGVTTRVSVGPDGVEGNSGSTIPSVSPDGRNIGFVSHASNLDPRDRNSLPDVFLHGGGGAVGVGGLTAVPGPERIDVSGWTAFNPTVLTSVQDGADDALTPVPDVELQIAAITYRPDEGDLLVRLRLDSIGSRPGIVYGMSLTVGGVRYEVRAVGLSASGPAAPHFAVYRCETVCVEHAEVTGGMGTGAVAVTAVPLSSLGAAPGATVTAIQAFAGAGEAATGALVRLDEASLPDTTIPEAQVALGIAPAGTPRDQVAFDTPASLSPGAFSGSVASPSPGTHDIWARACLGAVCDASSTRVRVEG